MPNAVVKNRMSHWPPHTVLVHVDKPITFYDRETGKKQGTNYIAVNMRHPDIHSADHARIDVFPCAEDGDFVEDTMVPIRKVDFQSITKALEELGFGVVDENDTLLLMPGG